MRNSEWKQKLAAKPQFGIRRLFGLTLLLAVALAAGKWAGLTETALIAGAFIVLPSVWLLSVALGGIVADVAAMSRRQRITHALLLFGGILFILLAVLLLSWLTE